MVETTLTSIFPNEMGSDIVIPRKARKLTREFYPSFVGCSRLLLGFDPRPNLVPSQDDFGQASEPEGRSSLGLVFYEL
jgi:hypothetical protein